ncbi:hypothetical protein RB195_012522 [Necator americanus]
MAVGEATLPVRREQFNLAECKCYQLLNVHRPTIWINERIPDSWMHAAIILLHKKFAVTDPKNYQGISVLRVMCKVLEWFTLDWPIKHRKDTASEEEAGFRPGRSAIA